MTYFIADLCSNWGGDLSVALDMIGSAADAGFDAVKVQAIRPHAMWRPGDPRIEQHSHLELSWHEVGMLAHEAQRNNLDFGVSVFDVGDVREAIHRADYLKVASCESMWAPLVAAVADSGADWAISTPPGWASPLPPNQNTDWMRNLVCRMHCIPQYPCPVRDVNLARLDGIRHEVDPGCTLVGYSDHTADIDVVAQAVAWYDAEAVELHWSSDYVCPEDPHSWDGPSFEQLQRSILAVFECSGLEAGPRHECWETMARDNEGWRR